MLASETTPHQTHPTQSNPTIQPTKMFALNPNGENSSGGKADPASKKYWHFLKLGMYFAAIRSVHVYLSANDGGNTDHSSSESK